jgi:hypothetical protein
MATTSRLATAGLLALVLVAAGCGDDTTATTTVPQPTSTAAPASTTATTVAPVTTAAPASTTAPPTTAATTTTAPAADLYGPADPPDVPTKTLPVSIDNVLPDGVYYGTAQLGEAPGVVMELLQLLTGDECEAWAAANGEECNNDYAVVTDPQGYRPLNDDAVVTVAASSSPGTSYAIDAAELQSLLQGNAPAAGAPADYEWVPFAFIVTIDDDEVVRIEQWWTP